MTLPRHEAERLLLVATGRTRSGLAGSVVLSAGEREAYDALVARRLDGEPLQYLEGTVDFGPLTLRIDGRALIPRPETEQMYEMVTGLLGETGARVIVDLCTGSGNLALALKHDHPEARVFGVDIDTDALTLACENADLVGLEVEWRRGDLYDALPDSVQGRVDAIVANPPYVASGELLPAEVVDHEPAGALFAGGDGTEVLRRIAAGASEWLRHGGLVVCELGSDQGDLAAGLFAPYDGAVGADLSGRDRWVVGRMA